MIFIQCIVGIDMRETNLKEELPESADAAVSEGVDAGQAEAARQDSYQPLTYEQKLEKYGKDIVRHLVPCEHCGRDILDHMTECPFCKGEVEPKGYRAMDPGTKKIIKIAAMVVGIIVVILIFAPKLAELFGR